MVLKFHELSVGDVFEAVRFRCNLIKIADNVNPKDPCDKQLPNALRLDNQHYVVVGYNSDVKLIKRRTDY